MRLPRLVGPLGGSIGTSLLNTILARVVASYLAVHFARVQGRPVGHVPLAAARPAVPPRLAGFSPGVALLEGRRVPWTLTVRCCELDQPSAGSARIMG